MPCLSSYNNWKETWTSSSRFDQSHLMNMNLTWWIWKKKSENECKDNAWMSRFYNIPPALVPYISSKGALNVKKSWEIQERWKWFFFSSTDPEDAKLNASSGSFASPRYQGPSSLLYANNFRATISISIPGDFGIIFTFSEFDLETKYNGKCLDYLEVRLCVTQWP